MTDSTNEPRPRLPRPRAAHLIPVATALMGAAAAWWGTRRRHVPLGTLTAPKIMTAEDFERTEPNRGRCASYPWTIPSRGWKDILWRTIRESSRDRLPVVAGLLSAQGVLASSRSRQPSGAGVLSLSRHQK